MNEQVSTYCEIIIKNLMSVHALACMYRVTEHEEYARSMADWIPVLERNLKSLKEEIERMKQ